MRELTMDKEHKETYLHGLFMGVIIGVLYLAIFSSILGCHIPNAPTNVPIEDKD